MKIETSPHGIYERDGLRYRITAENGDTTSSQAYAAANGYTRAARPMGAELKAAISADAAARRAARRALLPYAERRRLEYEAQGITPAALIIALREKIGEGRPAEFDALQAKVLAIKAQHPKPTP
jgi:hypothetical protein